MKRIAIGLAVALGAVGCTTRYQVRGIEQIYTAPIRLDDFVGEDPARKARQVTLEHQSVEYFDEFTIGVIEIGDDGAINRTQYEQVMSMVEEQTADGGLLVVLVHGWHHGARTCDRDLCCFRRVLQQLQQARRKRQADELAATADAAQARELGARYAKEKVVGVFIGWRGESVAVRYANLPTLFSRKRVAERIGRTAGKEILQELDARWRTIDDLTMVTVGHSLGGAFVFQAMKGKLTGDVADVERGDRRPYRIVRAHQDRAGVAAGEKAERADLGDLVVLVNPAIEASEYAPFDGDLRDERAPRERERLLELRLPYDKHDAYQSDQMPVLMVVASRGDQAVKYAFPVGRAIQALVTLRWVRLFRPAALIGMGRYGRYGTHDLSYDEDRGPMPPLEKNVQRGGMPSCDCSLSTAGLQDLGGFSLQRTGEAQSFGGFELKLTRSRQERDWDPSSPYFSVFADADVIPAHSDIFNSRFVGFLTAFINAYDERVRQYGPKDKREGTERGEPSRSE